ncbi:DUF1844 domain-containing protein [bacterium]|nr:DUF1844 domain-containing protein [bacterium]
MTRYFDDDEKEPPEIIIQDLRHSRGAEAEEEEAVEEAAVPEQPAADAVPEAPAPRMEVVEAPESPGDGNGSPVEHAQHDHHHHDHGEHDHHDHDHGEGSMEEQIAEAEYRQVLQIFELGLDNYQRSQLGIYIQFALIHMGRAPHPVTGLVATDMKRARFAIDLLHVSYTHLEEELQAQEKREVQSVIAQLQMLYTQLAGNAPMPPDSGSEPEA